MTAAGEAFGCEEKYKTAATEKKTEKGLFWIRANPASKNRRKKGEEKINFWAKKLNLKGTVGSTGSIRGF